MNLMEKRLYYEKKFFERAAIIHGDKYNYDKVVYTRAKDPVEIVCPEHGSFWQTPDKHLSGQNCKNCWFKEINKDKLLGRDEFVSRAANLHQHIYDYSLVEYKHMHHKIKVVCKTHGPFLQSPSNHLAGQGCPTCGSLRRVCGREGYYETLSPSNLYVLKIDNSFIKVGLAKDIPVRINVIKRESGYPVEKLYSVAGKAYQLYVLEQTILRLSSLKQHAPEIPFGGQSECFELNELDKVMAIIKEWEKFNKEGGKDE